MVEYDDDLDTSDGQMSIKFSPQVKRNLQEIAKAFGMSASALVKMLVEHGLMVEGVLESGGEIIARASNGTEFKLVRTGEKYLTRLEDSSGQFIWVPKITAGR